MGEGDQLHGYTVNSVTDVPEFDLVCVQLTHDKTSAQHLHLARDDSNNAFGYVWCTCLQVEIRVGYIFIGTVFPLIFEVVYTGECTQNHSQCSVSVHVRTCIASVLQQNDSLTSIGSEY